MEIITTLQQVEAEWLVKFFQALTFMGNQEFYLLLAPFLFWCVDWAVGARLTIMYLLAVWLNTEIKDIVQAPRPFQEDPSVILVDPEEIYGVGYGMPSGHAQWAMTVWGVLATWVQRGWFWLLVGILVFLIGLSRVYLGMHYPSQVAAGWGLGLVTVALYAGLYRPVEQAIARLSLGAQLGLAVVVPGALLWLHPVADVVAATAVLTGLGIGLVIARHYLSFVVEGSWGQRVARYLLGIIIVLAIYFGLSAIFPGEGESLYVPLRFVRYALLGLWISVGAPWLFSLTRLMTVQVQPA
ncbi:MAG: phosphatase PAP2 family protein [Ardenticatenaceae bacterium]|nr:phosphatase PAP2 family protein [Ardenticatenaceae bacterium]